MRILFVHPNYHSGGAEIAGKWSPAWVAYLAGYLKTHGYTEYVFVDAMTDDTSDEDLRRIFAEAQPDIIACTAVTPAIYKAEQTLKIAKEACPNAVTLLGGIHATFMFQQVLTEAPWIDAIVRGEGEAVVLEVVRAVDEGRWESGRQDIKGIAYIEDDKVVATPRRAHHPRRGLHHPRLGRAGLEEIHLHPHGRAGGHPQHGPRLPLHLQLLLPVEVLA